MVFPKAYYSLTRKHRDLNKSRAVGPKIQILSQWLERWVPQLPDNSFLFSMHSHTCGSCGQTATSPAGPTGGRHPFSRPLWQIPGIHVQLHRLKKIPSYSATSTVSSAMVRLPLYHLLQLLDGWRLTLDGWAGWHLSFFVSNWWKLHKKCEIQPMESSWSSICKEADTL